MQLFWLAFECISEKRQGKPAKCLYPAQKHANVLQEGSNTLSQSKFSKVVIGNHIPVQNIDCNGAKHESADTILQPFIAQEGGMKPPTYLHSSQISMSCLGLNDDIH